MAADGFPPISDEGKTMIDTHLHILPGVDDDPETMEESVALARVLVPATILKK